jgi:hypothetical protein
VKILKFLPMNLEMHTHTHTKSWYIKHVMNQSGAPFWITVIAVWNCHYWVNYNNKENIHWLGKCMEMQVKREGGVTSYKMASKLTV